MTDDALKLTVGEFDLNTTNNYMSLARSILENLAVTDIGGLSKNIGEVINILNEINGNNLLQLIDELNQNDNTDNTINNIPNAPLNYIADDIKFNSAFTKAESGKVLKYNRQKG